MKTFLTLLVVCLPVAALGIEPAEGPLGERQKLVLTDDFDREGLGPNYKTGIPAYDVTGGVLQGTQARADHGSSLGATLELPDGNLLLEVKFRFEGASSININLDDKAFQGVHAGHISRVRITPRSVTLMDDREGVMRNDIYALRKSGDPQKKAQGDRMAENAVKQFPVQLERGKWYRISVEIVADQMRVMIDGKPAGSLRSPGLAHPTKPDLRIGVWGFNEQAWFDDLRVWSVKPFAGQAG